MSDEVQNAQTNEVTTPETKAKRKYTKYGVSNEKLVATLADANDWADAAEKLKMPVNNLKVRVHNLKNSGKTVELFKNSKNAKPEPTVPA